MIARNPTARSIVIRRGFTLVEVLIVVLILSILAAIVVPRFTDASENARASTTLSQLRHVRDQIARYRLEHNENWPDLVAGGWELLTHPTTHDGAVDEAGPRGPYLHNEPINPFTNSTAIAATEVAGNGWYYDVSTGDFRAVGFDEKSQTYTEPTP